MTLEQASERFEALLARLPIHECYCDTQEYRDYIRAVDSSNPELEICRCESKRLRYQNEYDEAC